MTKFHVSWKSAGKVNFLKARVIKRRAWKALNVISTLAVIVNTGLVGTFLVPSTANATVTQPNLQIKKYVWDAGSAAWKNFSTDGQWASANPGDAVTFMVKVWNTGTGSGTTNIADSLDSGTNGIWASQPTPDTSNVTLLGGAVAEPAFVAGGNTNGTTNFYVYTYTGTLQSWYANAGQYFSINWARLSQNSRFSKAKVRVDYRCDLVVTKTGPASVAPNGEITYTLHYENRGTANCTGGGAQVKDTIPADTTYANLPANHTQPSGVTYNFSSNTITWNLGTVPPLASGDSKASGDLTFTVTANDHQGALCTTWNIENQAKYWAQEFGANNWKFTDSNPNLQGDQPFVTTVTAPCTGSLKVTKVVDSGDATPDQWSFTLGAETKSPASGQNYVIFNNLTAGAYTVTESTNVADYHQVSTTCTDVNVVAGQQATCEFHNARDTGNVTFEKIVVGGSAKPSDWTFSIGDQAYVNGQTVTLPTGTYQVTESGPAGYTNTGISGICATTPTAAGVATLTVTTNGGTCTFTNTRDTGTVIVHKDVKNPDNGNVTDNHGFEVSLSGNAKPVSENTNATYTPVLTGDYALVETADADYDFVSCTVGDSQESCNSFNVGKNETVHVYVVNKQKKATITISKDVRDVNGNDVADATSFNVTSGAGNFSIAEGSPKILTVNPGTYTFTEAANSNYVTTSTNPKSLTVASNGQASYTFVNKQKSSSISGKKFEDDNGNGVKNPGEDYLNGWEIYLDVNGNDQWNPGEPKVVTGNGVWSDGYYEFTNLTPGTYTVREVNKGGWLQTAPASTEYTINLGVNQSVNGKDFGNFELGKIWGYKFNDKNGDGNYDHGSDIALPGWTICLNGQNCVVTDQSGKYEFTGLTAGNYTVTEQLTTGWYAVYPQLTGYNVNITSGDNEHKDFFNFKGFDLTVKKYLDGDAKLNTIGDQTLATTPWTIELWKNGSKIDTKQTVNGTYTWTNLSYGEYEVKEIFNADEYQALLSDNITVPNWSDDNSSKTIGEFDAESGRNVEVTFINWQRAPVQLVGYKIICDSEQTLPDWAFHNAPGSITASTAQSFVDTHKGCELVQDWNFQWGFSTQVGNPGDNTGEAAANWHTFAANGTPVTVDVFSGTKNLRVREVWNNLYIPFDGTINPRSTKVGAEFYCASDIKNFDNYEYVDGVQYGLDGNQPTYYCVAFNVRKTGDIVGSKFNDLNGNGNWDQEEPGLADWTIKLYQSDALIATTTTDVNGAYSFSNLQTGDYTVQEVEQDGWLNTTGNPVNATVAYNQDVTVNFGNYHYGRISGYKYDTHENLLDGWTICLVKQQLQDVRTFTQEIAVDQLENCVVTGAGEWSDGYYEFTNLLPGTYMVYEQTQYGWVQESPNDPNYHTVLVQSGTGYGESRGYDFWNRHNEFNVDITKSVNQESVEAGTNLTYTLTWSVTGNTPVEVKLFDAVPANTTFVSADNGGFLDGTTVRWNLGTFDPSTGGSVTMTVKVNSPLDKGTVISNTGNICGLGEIAEGEPFFSNSEDMRRQKCDDSTVTTTVTSAPELGIAKVASPTTVGGLQDVTYTVTWSVAGNSKATNVVVNDPIPASTTYVSMGCGTTTGTCTTSTTGTPVTSATWNLGTRNPGEGGTLTLVVKTAISVPNGSVIPNKADIRSEEVDPLFAQADVKAATAPQLQITKTANATIVNPGDPISYTVKVKNIGTDTAVNAVMTDTLPAGFSFVSTSPVATSIVGQTATFALGTMAVGDEKTITYTVNVAPGTTAGTYDNIAKAKADNAPEVSTKVPVETRVPKVLGETTNPVLQLRKTVSKATVAPGDTVTYTVEIKNTGTGSAINLVLSDLLPVGFTFSGTTSTTKEWNLGDLAVGETKTVSYKVKVGSSVPNGAYENLAIAQADNHGKVTTSVPVTVKRGRVLGAAVDTGAGLMDLAVAGMGLSLIVLGFVLTRRKRGEELA